MPHWLYEYDTSTRSTFAVMDDAGNLIPVHKNTWFGIWPENMLGIEWF